MSFNEESSETLDSSEKENLRRSHNLSREKEAVKRTLASMNSSEIEEMTTELDRFYTSTNTREMLVTDVAAFPFIRNSISRSFDTRYFQNLIEREFPVKEERPQISELINLGENDPNKSMYESGDWVEIEGLDMKWRLDMITRVVKTAPDDFDWNDPYNVGKEPKWTFSYNAGKLRDINEEDVRAPESGLRLVFGSRPWIWQQWAALKVEERLRFQKGHEDDFIALDIQKYASELWSQWLDHPNNVEFKKLFFDHRIGSFGRAQLVNHIQKPFRLTDIIGEENEEWNFEEDDDINVFTYVSLLGAGTIVSCLVLFVQIAIPVLLLFKMSGEDLCETGEKLTSDGNDFDALLPKMMAAVIFTYYLFSVVPDTYYNFFVVAGSANSVFSRLLSLRKVLWLQADDTLIQMVGFKLDQYMNSAYQTILMMLNINVILVTDDVIEIVLNALAFIFIARIDEDLAKATWFDPEKRWIIAGAKSVALQTTLKLRWLSSPTLFSKNYNIDESLLLKACDNDQNLFYNPSVASQDQFNPSFMTTHEKIRFMCGRVAYELKNRQAFSEYVKNNRYFGLFESIFKLHPVFERYRNFRTWSRWNKILFLSPVPNLDEIIISSGYGNTEISKEFDEMYPLNFRPKESDASLTSLFIKHIFEVITFQEVWRTLKPAWESGKYRSLLFRFFDGVVLNWSFYVIQLLFPVYLGIAYYEVLYNIVTGKCFHPMEDIYELFLGLKGFRFSLPNN